LVISRDGRQQAAKAIYALGLGVVGPAAERSEFAAELIAALSDAAELTIDRNAHEVIAGWRATAWIKADKEHYARALAPTEGDFGPAEVIV
jgi:hypothetical protein